MRSSLPCRKRPRYNFNTHSGPGRLIEVCCTFNISKDIGSIVYNKGHNLNRNDHIHSRLNRVATSLNNVCIEQFLWFETVIF